MNGSFFLFSDNPPSQKYSCASFSVFLVLKKKFPSFCPFTKEKILPPIQRNWKQNCSDLALQFTVPPACFCQMHTVLNKMFLWWCSDSLSQRKVAGGKGIQLYVSLSPKCGSFLHLKYWSQIHICKWYCKSSGETEPRSAVSFCLYFLYDTCISV